MNLFLSRIKTFIRGEQNLDKLIRRGLKVGNNFKRMKDVIIDPSHCWHITIGNNVTLAARVQILAHDASTILFLNHTRVANTRIGDNVFIGAGAIVLPGVTIGNNVVVGAGSVVSRDIPNNSVALGNPARVVKPLNVFLEENRAKMLSGNVFGEQYTLRNAAWGQDEREVLLKACDEFGTIYVE